MQYVSFTFALDDNNMQNKALILQMILASQCYPLFFVCFQKKHKLLLHTFFVFSNEPQCAQLPSGSHVPRKIHDCSQQLSHCLSNPLSSLETHPPNHRRPCLWLAQFVGSSSRLSCEQAKHSQPLSQERLRIEATNKVTMPDMLYVVNKHWNKPETHWNYETKIELKNNGRRVFFSHWLLWFQFIGL